MFGIDVYFFNLEIIKLNKIKLSLQLFRVTGEAGRTE